MPLLQFDPTRSLSSGEKSTFADEMTARYTTGMATLVRTDEMGGATTGGQLALTAGALVAPPAFGLLADTVGYRASWWLLAAGCLLAAGLVSLVLGIESPTDEPALLE